MNIDDLRFLQTDFEISHIDNTAFLENIRKQFINKFPPKSLSKLTKKTYVAGSGDKNTFCYWVEWGTKDLGVISGSPAGVKRFHLWVDKKTKLFRTTNIYNNNSDYALKSIITELNKLLQFGKNNDLNNIKTINISDSIKGKILFLYYPTQYINIFSEHHIDYFLKSLNIIDDIINIDLLSKRDILLNFKNKDEIMSKWSIYKFTDFLYSKFGKPGKSKINPKLGDYSDDNLYPDILVVDPEFIDLIIEPNTTTYKSTTFKNNRNFELEQKRKSILGTHGELVVLKAEKQFLNKIGKSDYATMVKLKSNETHLGYDVLSYNHDGSEKYIEVKSTNLKPTNINFIISHNEYEKSLQYSDNYFIYIVFETKSINPKIFKIQNPFSIDCKLTKQPINYRVTANILP